MRSVSLCMLLIIFYITLRICLPYSLYSIYTVLDPMDLSFEILLFVFIPIYNFTEGNIVTDWSVRALRVESPERENSYFRRPNLEDSSYSDGELFYMVCPEY